MDTSNQIEAKKQQETTNESETFLFIDNVFMIDPQFDFFYEFSNFKNLFYYYLIE